MMRLPRYSLFALIATALLGRVPIARADGTVIEIANAQVSLIQNTIIAAPMAGIVESVAVKEGDQLEAGSLIVQLDAEQIQMEFLAAQAAFEATRMKADSDIDARYAKRTLEVRQRELQQSQSANENFAGAIPETEIAKLKLVVDQSQLAIEQAEHELEIAAAQAREKAATARIVETRHRKHSITAPKTGTVVELNTQAGEWVEPGKPIARLISTDPIRIECFVDGRVYGSELVGKPVQFHGSPAPNQDETSSLLLAGHVTFVSPELHPVTGQARLWAEIANPDGNAKAGMRGKLVIDTE